MSQSLNELRFKNHFVECQVQNYNSHINAKILALFEREWFQCPSLSGCNFQASCGFLEQKQTQTALHKKAGNQAEVWLFASFSLCTGNAHRGVQQAREHVWRKTRWSAGWDKVPHLSWALYSTGTRHPRQAQAVTNGPNFHLFIYLLCGPWNTCCSAPP